jgi:hypothetical protein
MIEQRGNVVGQQLITQRPADVGSVPMALEFYRYDAAIRGQQIRIVVHQADRHERAMDEH